MKNLLLTTIAVLVLVGCGRSNLWLDAGNGDFSAAEKRINSGEDLDARDALGRTPLYYAVYNEHLKIAELLVKNGANVNEKHKDDKIVLHLAAELGNLRMVRLLLKVGAKVNALDSDQDTPLDWAIGTLHNDTAQFLRKHGGKTGEELKAEGK